MVSASKGTFNMEVVRVLDKGGGGCVLRWMCIR